MQSARAGTVVSICSEGRGVSISHDQPVDDVAGSSSSASSIQKEGRFSVEERSSIHSVQSVKVVHEVISNFNSKKQELVKDLGFEGILRFPSIKQLDRRFSLWLLSMVCCSSQCLILPDGEKIFFSKDDIGLVFGIPCCGKKVQEAVVLSKQMKNKIHLGCWPMGDKVSRSVKGVIEVLSRDYGDNMDEAQEGTFKIAFVIFVMSVVFVPGAKYDYVSLDYWRALADPSLICTYDWSDYVLRRLLDSAAKVQSDIRTGTRSSFLTGCSLFLQVLYLDSIDLGPLSSPHVLRPRIAAFSYDTIRACIQKLMVSNCHDSVNGCFVTKNLRIDEDICYYWASRRRSLHSLNIAVEEIDLWEASIEFARVLRIPLEAIGPFLLGVAQFQSQLEPSIASSVKYFISLMVHAIKPYVNGVKHCFESGKLQSATPLDCEEFVRKLLNLQDYVTQTSLKRKSECVDAEPASSDRGDFTEGCRGGMFWGNTSSSKGVGKRLSCCLFNAVNNVTKSDGRPDGGYQVDRNVLKSMAQFYLPVNRLKSHSRIDLNVQVNDSVLVGTEKGVGCSNSVEATPPWDIGGVVGYNDLPLAGFLRSFVYSLEFFPDSAYLIVHHIPKHIELNVRGAIEQLTGSCEFDMDLFDAIIRLLVQLDDSRYAQYGRLRWRHFFESDIMNRILQGSFDLDDSSIKAQFLGVHLCYDTQSCSAWFFPCLIGQRWVCFALMLRQNQIIIFDPACYNSEDGFIDGPVQNAVEMLISVLSSSLHKLFIGWDSDLSSIDVAPFVWKDGSIGSISNRTGVACTAFCMFFDGQVMRTTITMDDVERLLGYLACQLIGLKGNYGKLRVPPGIIVD